MNSLYSVWTFVALAILSVGISVSAVAQSDISPASTSIRSAGQSIKHAGSDTWAATKDTYHAAKTALRDTDITAKVKLAFHRDPTTHPYDIDVTTTAGVVTLEGKLPSHHVAMRATHKLPSHHVAMRATQLAMETEGVRGVRNQMVIIAAAGSPSESRHE
jgi:osmotically-inducible protein OsmY